MTGGFADTPLTPLAFLERSEEVWGQRPAVTYEGRTSTYAEHGERVRRACGALKDHFGIADGDRVATLLPNIPEMLELHYAVPGVGAVLVPLNTKLAATDYTYILSHCAARMVVAADSLRSELMPALDRLGDSAPQVSWVGGSSSCSWTKLVDQSEPRAIDRPVDERTLLSINYTSGTTGRPKGVMATHRGAYLHSLGVIAEAVLSPSSGYLWTLPMFHCNGWAFTWAVTAMGAEHHCLERPDAGDVWSSLRSGRVTHLCAAPTVVVRMLEDPEARPCIVPVRFFLGGSPPSPALLERAAALNISVTHLYGLTETYGPIAVCAWDPAWSGLSGPEQGRLKARQGVATVVSDRIRVVDQNMNDVPRDGQTLGEVVMRGNNVMAGYYRDETATVEATRGGWFHSGDLAVMHDDGYLEIKDRLKDIVISGGENISTVEVEQVLNAHPSVAECAVVAAPDDRWGEVPVAFVTPRSGSSPKASELAAFARQRLAHYKVPKQIHVVGDLPKTSTGKIQKFILREQARG